MMPRSASARVLNRLGFTVACGACGFSTVVRGGTLAGARCGRCGVDLSGAEVAPAAERHPQDMPERDGDFDEAAFWANRPCCGRLPRR